MAQRSVGSKDIKKRRRSEYESYRPDSHSIQNTRVRDSRPGIPSRSSTYSNSIQKTFRTSEKSLFDSPRSPQISHGDDNSSANTNQAGTSKDPRKTRGSVESTSSEKSHSTLNESTVADYFRDLARQVSCEDRVQEAEKTVRVTKEEGRRLQANFPDHNPLADQYAKHLRRDEEILSSLVQLLADSKDRVVKTLANLPREVKDLLNGVIPVPTEASLQDKSDDLRSIVEALAGRVDNLTKQNQEQEMEIKRLKERSTIPPTEPLENKLTSRIVASQRDVDLKFVALDKKLQEYNESLTLYEKISYQQRDDLQKQQGEVKSLASKQFQFAATAGQVSTFQSTVYRLENRVDKLELQTSEQNTREAPRSPPRDDIEDGVTKIRTQQEEQKRQIANLSNVFVSRQEFSEGLSQLETCCQSSKKLLQDADRAQQDLSSRFSTLVSKIDRCADDIDQVKVNAKELSTPDHTILRAEIHGLSELTKKLQKNIDSANKSISSLESEVKTLTDFRGHYVSFYDTTQEQLRRVGQRSKADDGSLIGVKDDLQSRLNAFSEGCQKKQKSIDEFDHRLKTNYSEHTRDIADLRKKIKECEASTISALAQHAAVATDVTTLKTSIEQVSHSIQSLDTRYSAISTQKLYHSIVATIQPLLPRMHELVDQSQAMRNVVAASEQRLSLLDGKVKAMEAGKVEMTANIQALTNKLGESSTGQCARTVIQDNTSLQDLAKLIVELKQDGTGVSQKLVDELNEIRAMLKERKSEMTTLETTLQEQSKLVNKLRTEMGIVEDVQSRIQRAQTDMTTYQERLSKAETVVSRVGELEQHVQQLQKTSEESRIAEDQLEMELAKVEEGFGGSGTGVVELRERIVNLEDVAFPLDDRYVVCTNVASTVDSPRVQRCFKDCNIKEIRFGGSKNLISGRTGRYATVWIASSADVKTTVDEAIKAQNGERWGGRQVRIREIDRHRYAAIRRKGPASAIESILELQDVSNDRASEVPSSTTAKSSTMRSVTPRNLAESVLPDNTIEVARPSVLPDRPSATLDNTELPESSEEEGKFWLDKFGATQDGGQSSRPTRLARAMSSQPSIPIQGVAKRVAPDSGSSRQASKRGRRG